MKGMGKLIIFSAFNKVETLIYTCPYSLINVLHVLNERPTAGSLVASREMVFKEEKKKKFHVVKNQIRNGLVTQVPVFHIWEGLRIFLFQCTI